MNLRLIAGVVGAAVIFAACGDDGPNTGSDVHNLTYPNVLVAAPLGDTSESAEVVVADVACPPIDGYTGPVADEGVDSTAGGAATIDAGDFFFSPTCIVDDGSGTVTLTLENSGNALHNVSVADQGIDIDFVAGETIEVEFEVGDEPLVFICKYHRTAGMVGAVLPAG